MADKTIVIGDAHAPFEDASAITEIIEVIRRRRPTRIVIAGDWFDNYQLSRFDKDPRRINALQDDIDVGRDLIATIKRAAPKARIDFLEGNHEFRLRKYICSHPELASLRALDPLTFFCMENLGVQWHNYRQALVVDGFRIVHGHLVRKRAGYTAHAYLDMYWQSGMSGHTHRLGQIWRRSGDYLVTWIETGCLCRLNPEYLPDDSADWQHGYGWIENGVIQVNHL